VLYMILTEDAADALPTRRATRPAHLRYLQALIDAGRLFAAGPRPRTDAPDPGEAGFYGSLIIAEFGSLAEAEAWASQDPYALAGVFSRVVVQPFNKVLP
jgi:uncharacterized protein